jgi:hypothetical protein
LKKRGEGRFSGTVAEANPPQSPFLKKGDANLLVQARKNVLWTKVVCLETSREVLMGFA